MHPLNLNSLRVFDAAARHLNFRKASLELNVTQGAVAQRIRQLEMDLGTTLFDRHARGLSLTEAGETYFAQIHKSLREIDDATRALSAPKDVFKISLPPSFASKWFVPRLKSLADQLPNIEIQTIASETKANFENDGISLAIRIGDQPEIPNITAQQISPLSLTAVAAPDHPAASKAHTLRSLAKHDLLQDGHGHWIQLLKQASISPTGRIYNFNQTALAMDAAANGQGIALAPRLLIQRDITSGKLIDIWSAPEEIGKGYYLLVPTKALDDKLIHAISTWFFEEAQQSLTTG